jgi:Flp pilus assembly pilin Flp
VRERFGRLGVGSRSSSGRSEQRRPRAERGAVAVEYALGVALIVVAIIGSIEKLGDSSADELRDRGSAIGAPDLDSTGDPVPPPPPPPDPNDPDPPPLPETVVSITLTGDTDRNGQDWSASVTVTALDDASRPRESVQIQATWSSTSLSFSPQSIQCTTNLNGTCTMTIRNLSRSSVPDVSLTATAVSGPGVTAAPLPAAIVMVAP